MKRYFCLLLAVLLILTAAGCGSEPMQTPTPEPTLTPTATPAPTPTPPDYETTSYKFAEYMTAGDYTGALTMYPSAAAEGVTEQLVIDTWEPYAEQAGSFIGLETDRTMQGTASGLQYCSVFCEYENGGLLLTVVYTGNEDVKGFMVNTYLTESNFASETVSDATPLLWRVSGEDGEQLYLFGSMHAVDPGIYGLSETLMQAFGSSDALALELDTLKMNYDLESALSQQGMLYLTDGTTLADHLKPDTYALLVAFLTELDMWDSSYDALAPFAIDSLLDEIVYASVGISAQIGLDVYFNTLAVAQGKPVLEVESMQQQMDLFLGAPDLYWDCDINLKINKMEEYINETIELYEAYYSGDAAALLALTIGGLDVDIASLGYTAEEVTEIEAAEAAFMLQMLHDRNIGMAQKAEEYLKSGDAVFFVVGVAHMLGEDGIVELLTEAGYTVEQIAY